MRIAWGVVSALALLPAVATSQNAATEPDLCNYYDCALWMHRGDVVAGQDGLVVGRFGLFDAPVLRPMIQLSDSAAHYFGIVEDNYASGAFLTFFGVLVGTGGIALMEGKQESVAQWIGGSMTLFGYGGLFVGGRRKRRAEEALAQSIWWYNAEFVGDGSFELADSPQAQALIRGHHGRTGAVFGTLVGVAAGLLVSSRSSDISIARGLTETSLFGFAGGLAGRGIGVAIPR